MVTVTKKDRLVTMPEKTTNVPMWAQVKQPIHRLFEAISNVVAFEEGAIYKSKDWPYAWPRKK